MADFILFYFIDFSPGLSTPKALYIIIFFSYALGVYMAPGLKANKNKY